MFGRSAWRDAANSQAVLVGLASCGPFVAVRNLFVAYLCVGKLLRFDYTRGMRAFRPASNPGETARIISRLVAEFVRSRMGPTPWGLATV